MTRSVTSFLLIIATVAIFVMTYFGYSNAENQVNFAHTETSKQIEEPVIAPVALQVSKMSLDEKIGQMLIVGFENKYADEHIIKMITQYHIGGVNLLGRNVKDGVQTKQLIADLQKITDVPLFIATDQEGGRSSRFQFLSELTPQIKIKEIYQAEQVALNRAKELRELGVNMNFSPVVDYVSDSKSYLYSRTFGADPETTGNLGAAMVRGYVKGGIVPVVKHFPGYGNIFPDPHRNQATSNITEKELELYLTPFQKIIEDEPTVPIMTAHILIPRMDNKIATFSTRFLSEILRKQMGFDGVIITDELEMVSAGRSVEKLAVEAVEAGADIVISTYTPEKQINIFNKLKEAVLNGEILEKRIDESVIRILTLKNKI